jgi:hypothetical protein
LEIMGKVVSMQRSIVGIISGTLLLVPAVAALGGDIYTWRDAEGRTHFSDVPPIGKQEAKKTRGAAPVAATTAAAATTATSVPATPATAKPAPSLAEKDLEFRKRRAEAQEAADKATAEKAAAERKAADCQSARNQVRALESGQRVSRFNDKGEAVPLEDSQRQAEIERNRKFVEKACQ